MTDTKALTTEELLKTIFKLDDIKKALDDRSLQLMMNKKYSIQI